MISYKITSYSSVLPVSLADMKDWLKIEQTDTSEEGLLTSLIKTAATEVESYCNRALLTQTVVMTFDTLGEFELMRNPVNSITHIKYKDADGEIQTLSTDIYDLDIYAYPNRIKLKHDQDFPSCSTEKNNVVVTYSAGYGAAAVNIPSGLADIIKIKVAQMYTNRENVAHKYISMVERMMDIWRVNNFGLK